jgi:hypothetical protein
LFFDLTEVASNRPLRAARLRFFLSSVSARGSGLSIFVVSTAWAEGRIEMVSAPTHESAPKAVVGVEDIYAKSFVSVDVKEVVQMWLDDPKSNNGFAVAASPVAGAAKSASVVIASKEGIVNGVPAILDLEFGESSQEIELRAMERLKSSEGLTEIWNGLSPRVSDVVMDSLKGMRLGQRLRRHRLARGR